MVVAFQPNALILKFNRLLIINIYLGAAMKKLGGLLVLLTFLLMNPAYAITKSQAKPLTIVTEHFPPLQIVEDAHVVGGLATEIVRALLQQTGDNAQIRAYSWARAYKMAREQENVMIFSITRNAQRAPHFKWVGAILSLDNYLWRLKPRNDIKIETLEQAKNYTIAVPRKDIQQQALIRKGFTELRNLVIVTTYEQAIAMLLRGRVDLIAGTDLLLGQRLDKLGYNINQLHKVIDMDPDIGKLQIAFSLKTADSQVEEYRKALRTLKSDGTYDKILAKWQVEQKTTTTEY